MQFVFWLFYGFSCFRREIIPLFPNKKIRFALSTIKTRPLFQHLESSYGIWHRPFVTLRHSVRLGTLDNILTLTERAWWTPAGRVLAASVRVRHGGQWVYRGWVSKWVGSTGGGYRVVVPGGTCTGPGLPGYS